MEFREILFELSIEPLIGGLRLYFEFFTLKRVRIAIEPLIGGLRLIIRYVIKWYIPIEPLIGGLRHTVTP